MGKNKNMEISRRLSQAEKDAGKNFANSDGESPKVGDPVASCPYAVTVTIKAKQTACPGHDHIVRAKGSPSGGTYRWTVSGSDVQLLDADKKAFGINYNGDTVYLRCFKPDNKTGNIPTVITKVRVAYVHGSCTAQDMKTIAFHGVRFNVVDFKIDRSAATTKISFEDGMATLGSDGWRDGGHTSIDPLSIYNEREVSTIITAKGKVQILIDKNCPRANDCAKMYQLGWHQTIRKTFSEARYARRIMYLPSNPLLPLRDGAIEHPWFLLEGTLRLFEENEQTLIAEMRDSPGWVIGLRHHRDGSNLRRASHGVEFTTWLLVGNMELVENVGFSENALSYLKNFDWSFRVSLYSYLKDKKLDYQGSREYPEVSAPFDGKGNRKPCITGKSFDELSKINQDRPAAFIPLQVYDPEDPKN